MENLIIHKVAFTEEAIFDYEHCMVVKNYPRDESDTDWNIPSEHDNPLVTFPKQQVKAELEEYIQHHSTCKKKLYFRVKNYDEQLGEYILFFVKRGWLAGIMQNWNVVGICYERDWCQEHEEDGFYRNWYDTKIINLDNVD